MKKELEIFGNSDLPEPVKEYVLNIIKELVKSLKENNIPPELVDIIIQQRLDLLLSDWIYKIYIILNKSEDPLFKWIFQCSEEDCKSCGQECSIRKAEKEE